MPAKYLLICIVCVLLQRLADGQTCPGNDTAITLYCTSCSGGYLCAPESTDPLAPLECGDGEGCSEVSENCVATDTLEFNDCGCSDGIGGIKVGSYADKFDSSYYVTCDVTGTPTYSQCESGYFDNDQQACVPFPECPEGFTGLIGIGDACTSYLECKFLEDPETKECTNEEIFDFNDQGCYASDVCASNPNSEVVDPLKCNIFHTCLDGNDYPHCCPLGQNYDEISHSCVEASQSPCDRTYLNTCLDQDYENMYCKYCLTMNEGDTYSTYLGNECQTNYYECVTGVDGLEAFLRTCDEGEVYAADTGNCEFIEAHPECNTILT